MRPVRYSQLTSSCGGSAASRKSSMNSATNVTAVMAMVAWMPSRMYEALARQEALSSRVSMSKMDPPAHARGRLRTWQSRAP